MTGYRYAQDAYDNAHPRYDTEGDREPHENDCPQCGIKRKSYEVAEGICFECNFGGD